MFQSVQYSNSIFYELRKFTWWCDFPDFLELIFPSKKLLQEPVTPKILPKNCFEKLKMKKQKTMPTTLPYSIFHIVQAYRTTRFAYQKNTTLLYFFITKSQLLIIKSSPLINQQTLKNSSF